MPFEWHSSGLETALGEAGNRENGKEEEKEFVMGRLHECKGLEGLLGFNLGSRMGQSVGKGTEEERD